MAAPFLGGRSSLSQRIRMRVAIPGPSVDQLLYFILQAPARRRLFVTRVRRARRRRQQGRLEARRAGPHAAVPCNAPPWPTGRTRPEAGPGREASGMARPISKRLLGRREGGDGQERATISCFSSRVGRADRPGDRHVDRQPRVPSDRQPAQHPAADLGQRRHGDGHDLRHRDRRHRPVGGRAAGVYGGCRRRSGGGWLRIGRDAFLDAAVGRGSRRSVRIGGGCRRRAAVHRDIGQHDGAARSNARLHQRHAHRHQRRPGVRGLLQPRRRICPRRSDPRHSDCGGVRRVVVLLSRACASAATST